MKKALLFLLILHCFQAWTQSFPKDYTPYIELEVRADTLVTPDLVYINVTLSEWDTKNKISLRELEQKFVGVLKDQGIDSDKNLSVLDLNSSYKKAFLNSSKVIKAKIYQLRLSNATQAGRLLTALEAVKISNAYVAGYSYTKKNALGKMLRKKAIEKAKINASEAVIAAGSQLGELIYVEDKNHLQPQASGPLQEVKTRSSGLSGSRGSSPLLVEFNKIHFEVKLLVRFKIDNSHEVDQ